MAEFYQMPAISPTMEVGTLVEWRIAEGESFSSGAVVADVGTDKANMEAEIFDDGVLLKQLIAEGDEVPPGFPIAIWGLSADEDITALVDEFAGMDRAAGGAEEPAPAAKPEPAPSASPAKKAPETPAPVLAPVARSWMGKELSTDFADPPGDLRAGSSTKPRIVASPLAKKIAVTRGIDLHRIPGSGPGGRITAADLDRAPAQPAPAAGPAREDVAVRNSPMRKTIAKRLTASHQDIPVFYLSVTFDMQGFVDLRRQIKAQLPDVRVSYNDILIKAVARALSEYPIANSSWGDTAITQHGRVDVGVAVALDQGLITPVIRNADTKTVSQIGTEVRELAGRAREGKLDPSEYTGGTFTISNLGMMDISSFTAIINPPEVAILAVGELAQVPVVVDGALAVGWRMNCTLSCDHRVLDGAKGAEFLQILRRYVESPTLLLV